MMGRASWVGWRVRWACRAGKKCSRAVLGRCGGKVAGEAAISRTGINKGRWSTPGSCPDSRTRCSGDRRGAGRRGSRLRAARKSRARAFLAPSWRDFPWRPRPVRRFLNAPTGLNSILSCTFTVAMAIRAAEWHKLPTSLTELCINTTLRCGQSFRSDLPALRVA